MKCKSFFWAVVFCALTSPPVVAVAACPPAKDIAKDQLELFEAARAADNEGDGRRIGMALWRLWSMAPDAQSQELLDRGMRARSSFNFVEAIASFDRLVAYCPNYAEGYNQRAFVNFLRRDFAVALVDLDKALELNPHHVAAMTGKALTLIGLGREDEAQEVLRAAVALNPWVPERQILRKKDGLDL